jgi:hypothetical protein
MKRNRLVARIVAVVAAMLVVAPAAQADPLTPDNWAVRPAPNPMQIAPRCGAAGRATAGAGVDWADAALGGGAAVGLIVVAGAAAAGLRTRRRELTA